MNRYTVNHAYRSRRDGQDFGPWSKGDEAELSAADAEWVNRDSPGALAPVEADEPAAVETEADESDPADDAERQAPKTPNRQHKGGRNRGAA